MRFSSWKVVFDFETTYNGLVCTSSTNFKLQIVLRSETVLYIRFILKLTLIILKYLKLPSITKNFLPWILLHCPELPSRIVPIDKGSQDSLVPSEHLNIDLMGRLPILAKGNMYIFTVEDAFSQFIQAICAGKSKRT